MRTFGTFLALGIFALTVGCGSNSSSSDTGGTAGPGNTGSGGTPGGGGGGSSGSGDCNFPACVASLFTSCPPSGTCVEQSDSATMMTNICYTNGVKLLSSMDLTSASPGMTMTAKKNGTTCYSISLGMASLLGGEMTIKDGSGKVVATMVAKDKGETTVTCTGKAPVVLNASCNDDTPATSSSGSSSDSKCTSGTCTP